MDHGRPKSETAQTKRGPKRTTTLSARKRRRKAVDKKYRQTKVALSESFEAWKELKDSGGWTHGELAAHLMDVHRRHCNQPYCQQIAEESATGEETPPMELPPAPPKSAQADNQASGELARHALFSTPIEKGQLPTFPSDVSDVEGSSESEGSMEEDFQPLDIDQDNSSLLEESNVEDEVFSMAYDKEEDAPFEENPTGRLTGDCTPKEAVSGAKCVAYVSVLEDLIRNRVHSKCPTEDCQGVRQFTTTKRGSCAVISWKCPVCCRRSAEGSWASQPRVGQMYAGNIILHASLLLSGNSITKVWMLHKFANVWFPNPTQFYRLQRLYFAPVIEQFWSESRLKMLAEVGGGPVTLAGDARMDSPGHCASMSTYTLMEHDKHGVVSLQCVDVREAKHSHDMERLGFMRAMEDVLRQGVNVKELVTDAHTQIKSIMKKELMFKNIEHQNDIWHASKILMKRLSAAAKKKGCEVLIHWMPAIRNHFWHACLTCDGDAEKLKNTWIKVVYHACNEHEWYDVEGYTSGRCDHGPLPDERDKPWIPVNSAAHRELLDIVFDVKLMKSIPYFKNFRHTGYLESFHNHILMYAPKRMAFSYVGYYTRNRLAAIDFNHHKDRPVATDANGEQKVFAKYSKATKQWYPSPVKVPKDYNYIPTLLERIVTARENTPLVMHQPAQAGEDNPIRIRRHVTVVPRPTTDELKQKFSSRFAGPETANK